MWQFDKSGRELVTQVSNISDLIIGAWLANITFVLLSSFLSNTHPIADLLYPPRRLSVKRELERKKRRFPSLARRIRKNLSRLPSDHLVISNMQQV